MVKSNQLGFALPIVLGVLALAGLSCATAWRMQWLNQEHLAVQSRLLRYQHTAEGVFPLVVEDIIGAIQQTAGVANLRNTAGEDLQTHVFFPNTLQERDKLQKRIGEAMCQAGICAPKTLVHWSAQQWHSFLGNAQTVRAVDLPHSDISAYYWVEVWLNAQHASSAAIAPVSPFIYRITVWVEDAPPLKADEGNRPLVIPSNRLVMQAIWSRADSVSVNGQWHSWKLLA